MSDPVREKRVELILQQLEELPTLPAVAVRVLEVTGKEGSNAEEVVEATELLRGNIADLERTIIGLDHMVVGKRLAERWGLPATIRDCIWLHGQLPTALPSGVRNPRMVNLVTLADLLVREQHLGFSGNFAFTS